MFRSATARLTAGTLVLALPLLAAAGCGVEKKKSIKAEFTAAEVNLDKSKAVSVTLHLDDAQGNLAKAMRSSGTPDALVQAVSKGSITFVGDPAGNATFASLKPGANPTDLKTSLEKVNFGFVVRDDQATLGELRLVAGDLYAQVNLNEISRLAKAGGNASFDKQLDEGIGRMNPQFAQALTDVRAGKWLKLPLTKYLTQLQQLAKGFAPSLGAMPTAAPKDYQGLGHQLVAAVKPYVKVTDANDSSSNRVLDVKVQVRPALKALLSLVQSDKSLPFAGMLKVTPAQIDANVADGVAHGTITLKNDHLKQVTVDIESLRLLSKNPGKESAAGVSLVVDVDDTAAPLTAPTNLAAIDLGAILDQFMQGMGGSAFSG